MDIYNAKSVLSGKSCRSSHSIASMSPYHFLICFETPKVQVSAVVDWKIEWEMVQTKLTPLQSYLSQL